MKYGLGEGVIGKICEVFARFTAVEKAVLYGSRAQGTYRDGSDIDLTFFGAGLTQHILGDIADALDDLLLPYMFDLSIFDKLEHVNLRDHIQRIGVTFYDRPTLKKHREKGEANSGDAVMWETKKIGDVIKLEYGKPLPKEHRDNDGVFPAYGANGIKCRTNKSFFDKPSIIVGRKGSAGEVNLTEPQFWPLDVTYFVTFDETKYDLMFLYHCLKSLELTKLAKGVKPGVNRNDVYALEFPFPPLTEQKCIVAILDEAFEGIDAAVANAEKNLANARELFESYLNNVFTQKGEGWKSGMLSEIGADIKTGPFGSLLHKSDYIENGTPLINPSHINDGQVTPDMRKTVNDEALERLNGYRVQLNDVVIGRRGDMGRCAPITEREIGWLCGTGSFIIRPKHGNNAQFLSLFLASRL